MKLKYEFYWRRYGVQSPDPEVYNSKREAVAAAMEWVRACQGSSHSKLVKVGSFNKLGSTVELHIGSAQSYHIYATAWVDRQVPVTLLRRSGNYD